MENYKYNKYKKNPFLYLLDGKLYIIGNMVFYEVDEYNMVLKELYDDYVLASQRGVCEILRDVMIRIINTCSSTNKISEECLQKHIEENLNKEQREQLEVQVIDYSENYNKCTRG